MKAWIRLKTLLLTPVGLRLPQQQRNRYRGVALILVVISLAILASVVTDLGYNEAIRYKLAINQRDAMKAQALGEGALNVGRFFLSAQRSLAPLAQQLGVNGNLWEIVPLQSDLMKQLINGDIGSLLGIDSDKKAPKEIQAPLNAYVAPEGGFGGFDGSFDIEIQDEDAKVSLRNFGITTNPSDRMLTRKLLASLFAPARYDDLFEVRGTSGDRTDRAGLVANIFDWIDLNTVRTDPYAVGADWGRIGTGSETDSFYSQQKLEPKNAYFDSFGELRLVHGWNEEVERAFSNGLTIYGQANKVNILSAKDQTVEALVRACAQNEVDPLLRNVVWMNETIRKWRDRNFSQGGSLGPKGFADFLVGQGLAVASSDCQRMLSEQSQNFTLTAKATVNDVTRTLTLVTRVVNNAQEELYYYWIR